MRLEGQLAASLVNERTAVEMSEMQAARPTIPAGEVEAMLEKMESAMEAMELAMQRAREGDQQSSGGEREALVARVQQQLRSVMTHLPPAARERISPAHPTSRCGYRGVC